MSKRFYIVSTSSVLAISLAMVLSASRAQELPVPPADPGPSRAAQPADAPHPKELEALEKGPIHEAFAEPLSLEAQTALVVPGKPPEPVAELPPETRPEGRNVQWIPGYFQWQEDMNDFVWVSGFYRDVPPGRLWTPGTWVEVDGGWQWTSGFWSDGNAQAAEYLPEPPASLEQGPSSPAPGDNYLWAPGCWQYDNGGYAWQPGYWYEGRQDWVWVPSHYCYSPYGYQYVSGYWDYPFAGRGLLYAPIYWRGGWGGYTGYRYRPFYALNTALLFTSLFLDNHHRHYYYGYHHGGRPDWLHEWGHDHHGHHGGKGHHKYYDPDWAHHDWNRRHGRDDFDRDGRRGDFDRDGRGPGGRRGGEGQGRDRDKLVTTVDNIAKENTAVKLRRIEGSELKAQENRAEQFRRYSEWRAKGQASQKSQAGVTGEIRRRGDSARIGTDGRVRVEGDSNAQLGQGEFRQGENRSRDWNRGEGRVRAEGGASTDGGRVQGGGQVQVQGEGSSDSTRTRLEADSRQQFRGRVESSDGSNRRYYRSQPGQQGPGGSAQVQSKNSGSGNFTPRTEYRTIRPQSSSESGGSAQNWSGQVRRYVPQGGGESAARVRSYQGSGRGGGGSEMRRSYQGGSSRSFQGGGGGGVERRSSSGGGGGGGGGNFERRGSSGGGGGGERGGGGGGEGGRGGRGRR